MIIINRYFNLIFYMLSTKSPKIKVSLKELQQQIQKSQVNRTTLISHNNSIDPRFSRDLSPYHSETRVRRKIFPQKPNNDKKLPTFSKIASSNNLHFTNQEKQSKNCEISQKNAQVSRNQKQIKAVNYQNAQKIVQLQLKMHKIEQNVNNLETNFKSRASQQQSWHSRVSQLLKSREKQLSHSKQKLQIVYKKMKQLDFNTLENKSRIMIAESNLKNALCHITSDSLEKSRTMQNLKTLQQVRINRIQQLMRQNQKLQNLLTEQKQQFKDDLEKSYPSEFYNHYDDGFEAYLNKEGKRSDNMKSISMVPEIKEQDSINDNTLGQLLSPFSLNPDLYK